MLTVNIAQKLKAKAARNAQKEIAESDAMLDSVKGLLNNQDKATMQVLDYFGTAESIKTMQKQAHQGKMKLNGEVVSKDDIENICLNYNLRFLNTEHYIKAVPLTALNDIKNFKEKTPGFDSRKLFIIAPKSHFAKMEVDTSDPVVLYAQPFDNYAVVTSFGNDFTILRRIQGFVLRYSWVLPVVMAIAGVVTAFFMLEGKEKELAPLGMLAGIPFLFIAINSSYSWNWNSRPSRR